MGHISHFCNSVLQSSYLFLSMTDDCDVVMMDNRRKMSIGFCCETLLSYTGLYSLLLILNLTSNLDCSQFGQPGRPAIILDSHELTVDLPRRFQLIVKIKARGYKKRGGTSDP